MLPLGTFRIEHTTWPHVGVDQKKKGAAQTTPFSPVGDFGYSVSVGVTKADKKRSEDDPDIE